jgi:hypothetical protein
VARKEEPPLAGRNRPHTRASVSAGGAEQRPVRAERDVAHVLAAVVEQAESTARPSIPQTDRPVVSRGGEQFPVPTELDVLNVDLRQHVKLLAAADVEDPCARLAVPAEGERRDELPLGIEDAAEDGPGLRQHMQHPVPDAPDDGSSAFSRYE